MRFIFITNNAVVIALISPMYHIYRKRFIFDDVHWKKSWISSNRINGSVLSCMKYYNTASSVISVGVSNLKLTG